MTERRVAAVNRAGVRALRRGIGVSVLAILIGVAARPADACEPVKRPLRDESAAALLVTSMDATNPDVVATVVAGRSATGDVPPGRYVFVPWAFGPDCRPLAWGAGMPAPWPTPPGPAVYAGQLRARDGWIGGRPTVDVYMAALQPLWAEGAAAPEFPGEAALLTAREFFDFYLSLPTGQEFDRRVAAALDRVDRWVAAHPSLASREPARSMASSLRWLWTHDGSPAASAADVQDVDRRRFDVVVGTPGTYSVYLEFEDDQPGGADRSSGVAVRRFADSLHLRVIPQRHPLVERGVFSYGFLLARDAAGLQSFLPTNQPGHGPSADDVRAMDFRNSDNTGPNAVGPKNVDAAGAFRRITYTGYVMEIRVLSFEIAGLGPSAVPGFTHFASVVTVRDTSGAQATPAVLPAERLLSFSNVRPTGGDDSHAYGIVIELFKHDGVWTGFMSEYVGPVADPPAARLDDLRVDEGTGRITFTATLTIGATMARGTTSWVPARSRYEFSGTIGPDTVTGELAKRPADYPSASPAREHLVLRREPPKASDMAYDTWIAMWRTRLGVRGPDR